MKLLDLLKADSRTIESALLGRLYDLVEEADAHCRIIADDLTIRIGWDHRDQQMYSLIKPSSAPQIFIETSAEEIATEHWLRPYQAEVPERPSGPLSRPLLNYELNLVEKAMAEVFSDESKVRDSLIYVLGFYDGYTLGRKDAHPNG